MYSINQWKQKNEITFRFLAGLFDKLTFDFLISPSENKIPKENAMFIVFSFDEDIFLNWILDLKSTFGGKIISREDPDIDEDPEMLFGLNISDYHLNADCAIDGVVTIKALVMGLNGSFRTNQENFKKICESLDIQYIVPSSFLFPDLKTAEAKKTFVNNQANDSYLRGWFSAKVDF